MWAIGTKRLTRISDRTFPPGLTMIFCSWIFSEIFFFLITYYRVSVVTALSIEYFKENMSMTAYPPDDKRHFVLSHLTPFGTRLETELIGCASNNPEVKPKSSTTYTIEQNGYKSTNAANKFIRIRWYPCSNTTFFNWKWHRIEISRNNGILPLNTIPGNFCMRPDGLCDLESFIASQQNASELSNYQYAVCDFFARLK